MWESPGESGQGLARFLMFIHGLWKIAGNDGRFLSGLEGDFYCACSRPCAISGQTERADVCRPARVFSVGNPAAATRMGEVSG